MKIPKELIARILSISADIDDTWSSAAQDEGLDPTPVETSVLDIMRMDWSTWISMSLPQRYEMIMNHLDSPKKYHSFYE